jgi:hypothetical protein
MIIYVEIPKSKPRKLPKKVQAQYDDWLNDHKQKYTKVLKTKTNNSLTANNLPKIPTSRQTPNYPSHSPNFSGTLTKTGIMKEYHLMTPEERQKIDDLGKRVAPLHKGNYVYISEGMNPAGFGRKNEIL